MGFVDEVFLEGRVGGYFAGVSFVLWDMRYGIPLESVGYSYGRYAWAWPRGFLDPYAVYVLRTRGLPSYGIDKPPREVERGLRIGAVLLGEFAYCP